MHKLVPMNKIEPNPFRYMERYPVKEQKIQMLMDSMGRTGFWDNVVGRKENGFVQLAYGHHRWIAFKKKFGKQSSMNLIIRDLSDEDMLRVMADENAEEYGHCAEVEQETIRAIVQAYADGKIELPKIKKGTDPKQIRWAPCFCRDKIPPEPFNALKRLYTAESVARFLGWMCGKQVSPRVRNALADLEAIEEEVVDEEDLKGLSSGQAVEIAGGAMKIKESFRKAGELSGSKEQGKKMEKKGRVIAKRTAKKVASKLKEVKKNPRGKKGYGVREVSVDMKQARSTEMKVERVPTVDRFVVTLSRNLENILGKKDPRWDKLNEIVKYRENIEERTKKNLTVALGNLIDRSQAMIDAIQGDRPKLKP